MERKDTLPVSSWYKERLQTKYLKATTNKSSLASSCWCFVNTDLSDLSDCSSVLFGIGKGVSPVIFNGNPRQRSSQKPTKSVSKEHACFSKQMIQKQISREYVAGVEKKLKQHPLTLYPHYKDHMTPELFDKVVSILDPDMCVNSASALPTGDCAEDEMCPEPSKEEVEVEKQPANKLPNVLNQSPPNICTTNEWKWHQENSDGQSESTLHLC